VKATTSGAIRDRDLRHPAMKTTWRKAHDLGLAVQMHLIPLHAPEIADLAREFSSTNVILDHLARAGQGSLEQYNRVLDMGKLPNVYMKYSGVRYSSKQEPPYRDVAPLIRRTFDAFGPDRMIWGGLGMDMKEFRENSATLDTLFDFASAADRAKIRGGNAARLFRFQV
jgi:predicted TIM-barrel fold metal-dependent hydrolase